MGKILNLICPSCIYSRKAFKKILLKFWNVAHARLVFTSDICCEMFSLTLCLHDEIECLPQARANSPYACKLSLSFLKLWYVKEKITRTWCRIILVYYTFIYCNKTSKMYYSNFYIYIYCNNKQKIKKTRISLLTMQLLLV